MAEIVELRIYAQRFADRWYPVGSDTPIPSGALVEPELPFEVRALLEPGNGQMELGFNV